MFECIWANLAAGVQSVSCLARQEAVRIFVGFIPRKRVGDGGREAISRKLDAFVACRYRRSSVVRFYFSVSHTKQAGTVYCLCMSHGGMGVSAGSFEIGLQHVLLSGPF